MMQFQNPIVGLEELIRSAIKSRDYEAGVSGWRIAQDGTAEFSDLTIRSNDGSGNSIELNDGEITITNDDGDLLAAVQFDGDGTAGFWTRDFEFPVNTYAYLAGGELQFGTIPESRIDTPAFLQMTTVGSPTTTTAVLSVSGPRVTAGTRRANIDLRADDDGTSRLELYGDAVEISNIASGSVVITPVANTPTSIGVTGLTVSGTSFLGFATGNTGALAVVQEVSVSNVSGSGLTVWIMSSSTTNRTVNWMVIGNG